jgi:predicted nucleic acid-binding protein
MTAQRLEDCTLVSGQMWYLDTSALIALAVAHEPQTSANQAEEFKRAKRIREFADRVNGKGARLITTILAIEELAGHARSKARKAAAQSRGMSWKDLKQYDPTAAAHLDIACRDAMLDFMEVAANVVATCQVAYEFPTLDTSKPVEANKKLRKLHRELLRLYVSIDAMDALHIAFGRWVGTKSFVSFDHGWQAVTDIDVGY